MEVRDGTGTPLIGWLDNDLDYTFNEIRKDGQIDTEDVYVSISRHRRSDGTTLVTWTDETGAKELTFLGPAYEQAWEEAEEQTRAWIKSQAPRHRASLEARHQDFI